MENRYKFELLPTIQKLGEYVRGSSDKGVSSEEIEWLHSRLRNWQPTDSNSTFIQDYDNKIKDLLSCTIRMYEEYMIKQTEFDNKFFATKSTRQVGHLILPPRSSVYRMAMARSTLATTAKKDI